MEVSISFCRAMRACHQSACSFFAALRPLVVGLARDLPFLPLLLERGVQLLAQRLQRRLPLVPDDIDLGVVGDRLERDVRHALVDEAVADVPVHGLRTRRGAGDLGFLELAFAGIGQQVERIARAHDAGAGQRQRHARGVDRDPAAAPLLGDVAVVPEPQVGSSTRSPGSVAIRRQRSNDLRAGLNDIDFVDRRNPPVQCRSRYC